MISINDYYSKNKKELEKLFRELDSNIKNSHFVIYKNDNYVVNVSQSLNIDKLAIIFNIYDDSIESGMTIISEDVKDTITPQELYVFVKRKIIELQLQLEYIKKQQKLLMSYLIIKYNADTNEYSVNSDKINVKISGRECEIGVFIDEKLQFNLKVEDDYNLYINFIGVKYKKIKDIPQMIDMYMDFYI